jgi:small acid-soluble spore protein D (minor alpha/beta-type SASP)
VARRRRNRLLVPEAREALDAIMQSTANHKAANGTNRNQQTEVVGKVAQSLGIPYSQNGDNGNLTTRQAGRIGGQIGGSMVQKLVAIAEEALAREQSRNGQ